MSSVDDDVKRETAVLEDCIGRINRLRPSQADRVSRMLMEYFRRMDFIGTPTVHTAAGGTWRGQ